METSALTRPIRVALADDHPLVRQGLKAVLDYSEGVELVAEASNGRELIEQVAEHRPDVVLVDIGMGPMDGLEAVRRIRKVYPAVKALMLTGREETQFFDDSIRAGACGYLRKTIPPLDLINNIKAVASGQSVMSPHVAHRILSRQAPGQWDSSIKGASLTDRELEVLKLVAGGKSNKEIARAMGIGAQTVKTHVSHILSKLGVPDRAGAVARAFRTGLVE